VSAQQGGGNAVQVGGADSGPEKCGAVSGECDAVRSGSRRAVSQKPARDGERSLAPDGRGKLGLSAHRGVAVEVAPGGRGAEIDRDKTIAAFGAGIGNVGDAKPGCGDGGAEVKSDIVEVGVWVGH